MPARRQTEARLNLRISKSVNDRVRQLADVMGLPHNAIATTALVMGLRILEQNTIGVVLDPEVLAVAQRRMYEQIGQDIDQMAAELEPPESKPVDRPGFRPGGKPRSELQPAYEYAGYMRGL